MQKSDAIASRDTVIWIGAMILAASIAIYLWPSWWSVPFWLIYGVLYGSGADSRWRECGHKTAFKTPWMNAVVYQIACFMMVRNPVVWRSSHVRHHTDTIVVGRDPEIVAMRPPDLLRIALAFTGITDVLYAVTALVALWVGSVLPLMLIGLPRLYGAWHHVMTGLLQHLGLAENVSDHRLNTRTVLMNPVSRFIYLNMNYHLEHHMFTMVPYYNLPKLHALIKHDLPTPDPSIWAAYRQLAPGVG